MVKAIKYIKKETLGLSEKALKKYGRLTMTLLELMACAVHKKGLDVENDLLKRFENNLAIEKLEEILKNEAPQYYKDLQDKRVVDIVIKFFVNSMIEMDKDEKTYTEEQILEMYDSMKVKPITEEDEHLISSVELLKYLKESFKELN